MNQFSNNGNLGSIPKLELDWSDENAEKSLKDFYQYSIGIADKIVAWYVHAKSWKKVGARAIRFLAILFGAMAAILPTLGEMYPNEDHSSQFKAGWTTVLLATAAALLLLDRFFGFSSSWMRYIVTEMEIRQLTLDYQVDWEMQRANWDKGTPTRSQAVEFLGVGKSFLTRINTLMKEETNAWVREFQDTIKLLDESIKKEPVSGEQGAFNLTVTNADKATQGWELILDEGDPVKYSGSTAAKRNIIPGRHHVKIIARIQNNTLQAEKVITIPRAGTCSESITLA
jgi:hypothetical protein